MREDTVNSTGLNTCMSNCEADLKVSIVFG